MPRDTTVLDLYIKLEDPTGAHKPVISYHRVWNKSLFLDSLRERYEKADNPDDRRLVKVTTQGVYRKSMGYKPEHCNDN